MNQKQINEAVAKGIEALDAYQTANPTAWAGMDWRTQVDWERLDMQSSGRCVLGQLFDGYWIGVEIVAEADGAAFRSDKWWGVEHGFYLVMFGGLDEEYDREYTELTQAWRTAVGHGFVNPA